MIRKLAAVVFLLLSVLPAAAQNLTTVTATNITDFGNVKLVSGQICMLGTDANDVAIPVMVGGGGQVINREACATVVNGAITQAVGGGTYQVANPANTSPSGILYRITITDQYGSQVRTLRKVQFSGAAFNLDTYNPGVAALSCALPNVCGETRWLKIGTPAGNPPPGYLAVYAKTSDTFCQKTAGGAETCGLGGGGGGGTPGGSNTQLQYNNSGAFGGITNLTSDGTVTTAKAGANWLFADPADATKKLQLNLASIATGATRSVAFPDFNGNAIVASNAPSQSKIPIGQPDGSVAWADPLVQGLTAHNDPGSSTNPVAAGGYASAAAPTDVSADGDIVRAWFLRSGAGVFQLSHAGALYKATTPSDTQPVSASSLPLPTGAATLAEQQTQSTHLDLLNDMIHATNAALNKAAAIAGQLDDTSPTDATENNVAAVRITPKRSLHVTLRDGAGDSAMDDANDAVKVNVVAGGAGDGKILDGTSAGQADVIGGATSGTEQGLVVRCASGCAGSGGTSQADESGFTEGTTNATPVAGVLNDSIASDPSEDQAAAVRITAKRGLHVNMRSAAGTEPAIQSTAPTGSEQGLVVRNVNSDAVGSTTALNALNAAASVSTTGAQGAGVFIAAGTLAGTVVAECSNNGSTNWTAGFFYDQTIGAVAASLVFTNPNAATKRSILCGTGNSHARVRVSAFTSGAADGTVRASMFQSPVVNLALLGGNVVGSSLPVNLSAAVPAGTNNIGDVDVLTLPALPAGTNNIGDVDVLTLPALAAGTNNIGDVDIASAIPAGNNNIGDVDVASLPALPAGTNNIGDVDVLTLPALPAGTNNIGDVDIASLPNEGQQNMAGSISVAIASDQGTIPTAQVPRGVDGSYIASTNAITPAASATDIALINGNATNTVLLYGIRVSCTQTTAGIVTLHIIKRSTANSGGTSAGMTEIPLDSNYAAASTAALTYSANPTPGTSVGNIDTSKIGCMAAATATPNDIYISPASWRTNPVVLRGTAQGVAVNLGGVTVSGGNFAVTFEWRETTNP